MAAQWPLQNGRPVIQVLLVATSGPDIVRTLVADTGAGTNQSVFQFLLAETDCLQSGGILIAYVQLGGAYFYSAKFGGGVRRKVP